MKNKNIIDILLKIYKKTKNLNIKQECLIWKNRLSNKDGIQYFIKRESEIESLLLKGHSIVSNEKIWFGNKEYSYLELKEVVLVRKFVENLISKYGE